jgi:hypothetical protein
MSGISETTKIYCVPKLFSSQNSENMEISKFYSFPKLFDSRLTRLYPGLNYLKGAHFLFLS